MSITAAMVKELRDTSGAGMMDAKKALLENNGNMDAAVDWLRTKGLAKAAKKSDRTAAEGLVCLEVRSSGGVALEVNSETDFVAKTEEFQQLVLKLTDAAEHCSMVEDLRGLKIQDKTVDDLVAEKIAKIGENITVRRLRKLFGENISMYVHNSVSSNMGKIGVLVGLESEADNDQLEELGKKIAMHIAATNPISISIEDIPADILEREKNILAEEARSTGKPEEIIEKMTEGRLKKYYQESVLLEQIFVVDGESKISDILNSLDKPVKIAEFVRMGLGEGIEKKSEDFANEVDSLIS